MTALEYRDIYGIEGTLTIPLDSIVLIEGENGSGKTSLLQPLRDLVDGGHDPEIIRAGAKDAELKITFSNGWSFRFLVTEKDTYRQVRDENGKKVPGLRETEFIKGIFDALSFDPMRFVDPRCGSEKENDKARLEMLLSVANLTITEQDLAEALGRPVRPGAAAGDALQVIARYYAAVESERRDINRDEKTKRIHGEQLLAAVPAQVPTPAAMDGLKLMLDAARKSLADGEKAVEKAFAERKAEIDRTASVRIDARKADADAKIEAIRRQLAVDIEDDQRDTKELIDAERATCDEFAVKLRAKYNPDIERFVAEIADRERQARQYYEAENTRAIAADAIAEADGLRARSQELTAALRNLEALKTRLMTQIPIPDVTISEDGKIYQSVEGTDGVRRPVNFNLINLEKRLRMGLNMSVLRYRGIGPICMDGLEALDTKHREMVINVARRLAAARGMQFALTRVADCPLTVRSIPVEDSPVQESPAEEATA